MNKKIILIIICSLVLLFFILAIVPWLVLYFGLKRLPDPPVPKVIYEEFPFKLEYEINGERMIAEDKIICEYDGVQINEGRGKFRTWKKYLAGSPKESDLVLLELEDGTKIYYNVGDSAYYMGDAEKPRYANYPFNGVYVVGASQDELYKMKFDEMLEFLNIKLIDWQEPPAIENEFVE